MSICFQARDIGRHMLNFVSNRAAGICPCRSAPISPRASNDQRGTAACDRTQRLTGIMTRSLSFSGIDLPKAAVHADRGRRDESVLIDTGNPGGARFETNSACGGRLSRA